MKGFKVDKEWMERNVLSNPTVQSALNAKARRIAPIVKRIALKEGDRHYAESVRVMQGRRSWNEIADASAQTICPSHHR